MHGMKGGSDQSNAVWVSSGICIHIDQSLGAGCPWCTQEQDYINRVALNHESGVNIGYRLETITNQWPGASK